MIYQSNKISIFSEDGKNQFELNKYNEEILKFLHSFECYLIAKPLRISRNIILPIFIYDSSGNLKNKYELYLRGSSAGPVILFELAGNTLILK